MTATPAITSLVSALGALEPFADPIDLLNYRRDCSMVAAGQAQLAVQAASAEDIVSIVQAAAAHDTPMYVRGGGTMYAGGANPHAGGLVIDVSRMTRVLELDLARGVVVVEPGIRFSDLTAQLAAHGQTVGIVPSTGPAATVGGALSSHALGTGSARHQSMGDCVAGLEVVLVDGTRLRTGSAACRDAGFFQRYCMGPDLTGLFIGADATLGVVTAVALWLYPLPAARSTFCLGFPEPAAAGRFLVDVQARELTRQVWYAAGYEAGTVRARVLAAQPEFDVSRLPGYCIGFDIGGERDDIARDEARLAALASEHGGAAFAAFDTAYFNKLRLTENYWYSFAGYFSRSRCAILMTSLPCDRLADLCAAVDALRARWPAFVWGAATVVCRRGLHGGVMAFYDERSEWPAIEQAIEDATQVLRGAGCVPYKSGKLWAQEVKASGAYHQVLRRLKRELDPKGLLSPGNLGL
ncbi:MAG: FAD-binding oxidoreductase [Gammaproteobacteria bacterium]|nr:FAD-binding oxidoreductase [Gammaproteobacteria bacterium]